MSGALATVAVFVVVVSTGALVTVKRSVGPSTGAASLAVACSLETTTTGPVSGMIRACTWSWTSPTGVRPSGAGKVHVTVCAVGE